MSTKATGSRKNRILLSCLLQLCLLRYPTIQTRCIISLPTTMTMMLILSEVKMMTTMSPTATTTKICFRFFPRPRFLPIQSFPLTAIIAVLTEKDGETFAMNIHVGGMTTITTPRKQSTMVTMKSQTTESVAKQTSTKKKRKISVS